jgi:hypothetical protein
MHEAIFLVPQKHISTITAHSIVLLVGLATPLGAFLLKQEIDQEIIFQTGASWSICQKLVATSLTQVFCPS